MNDKLRIEDFEPGHFARLRLRKEDSLDLAGIEPESLFSSWKGGRTVFLGQEPAMVYGYWEKSGTAGIWALTTPFLNRFPLFVTRLARTGIEGLFQCGNHRVETYCHSRNARSFAWLTRSLGFRVEGLMRRCGPNKQDRYLLALPALDWPNGGRTATEKTSNRHSQGVIL